ncbi:MAG: DUF881 domain-containing protein [Actinomycetota bacterium]|nr:DUF881 domain-containing protein [Actinomycetota bacterium]
MTVPPDDAVPAPPRLAARLTTGCALALLAAVLVVAARSDPSVASSRTGRRVELVELIRAEQARTADLERRVAELSAQVEGYEKDGSSDAATRKSLQARIDEIAAPAGMTAVTGPGVVATLTDSTLATSPTGNLNDLVIHEQDLQAVINALWAGGAEAMSVNGQRVQATTAIRCVGNTLLLHGGVYSPPYVVRAIGDHVELRAALDRDPVVNEFRAATRQYGVGFDVSVARRVELPPYDGAAGVKVGEPVAGVAG